MHPQLQPIADEYRSAQARLHELVRAVPAEQWPRRHDPARWSVAECVAHLNLTSMARSEERRVGKECRSRGSRYPEKKQLLRRATQVQICNRTVDRDAHTADSPE